MAGDIDDAADELADVQSGSDLDSIPIVDVTETDATVVVTLGLPSGDEFDDEFTKPPVWGANCELQSFLDAMDVGPNELDELVGERVAAEREVGTDGLAFGIDREAVYGGN